MFKSRPVNVLNARQLTPAELKDEHRDSPQIKRERTVDASYNDGGWFPHTQRTYFISEPDEPGDGTVPHRSGIAPKAHCVSVLQVKVRSRARVQHQQRGRQRARMPFRVARHRRHCARRAEHIAEVRLKADPGAP